VSSSFSDRAHSARRRARVYGRVAKDRANSFARIHR
jgi:hypothetical protein